MKSFKVCITVFLALILAVAPICAFAGDVSIGYVNTNGAILCSKSFDTMIDRLSAGTKVLFYECGTENLVKVVLQNGEVGYAYRGYVTERTSVSKGDIGKTVGGDVIVYTMKNGKLEEKWHVSSGLPVVVVATKNGYAKVKNLSGKVGYIKLSNLKHVF